MDFLRRARREEARAATAGHRAAAPLAGGTHIPAGSDVTVVGRACAQDVGRAPGTLPAERRGRGGRGRGGTVTEETALDPNTAKVRAPSPTGHLVPAPLDTAPVPVDVLGPADDHAPYGLCGVGEAPTPSTPAALAATGEATGRERGRTPARPGRLTGT
ncbi:hypothetical protein [Streptomyces griseus]|uniref:hypothetical protein n=1 Tax=Streptomyces griseus TaxID=1911 RepID=UPI0008407DB3|nr:hypothetical protein [Streptomyces griseus]